MKTTILGSPNALWCNKTPWHRDLHIFKSLNFKENDDAMQEILERAHYLLRETLDWYQVFHLKCQSQCQKYQLQNPKNNSLILT